MVNNFISLYIQHYILTSWIEKNREKLTKDGAIPALVRTLVNNTDFTLKLACTATLWNLAIDGK